MISNMNDNYFFAIDEPYLLNKNIICAFHISNIKSKRCFFFIEEKNKNLVLYYMLIKPSEFIDIAKKYRKSNSSNIIDIVKSKKFIDEYNKLYLKRKNLKNQEYIKKTIDKMSNDRIYNAKNDMHGLDGFSVELKLNKNDNPYYSWCNANDEKYFYVLDFINYILDEIAIDKNYRFRKCEHYG